MYIPHNLMTIPIPIIHETATERVPSRCSCMGIQTVSTSSDQMDGYHVARVYNRGFLLTKVRSHQTPQERSDISSKPPVGGPVV